MDIQETIKELEAIRASGGRAYLDGIGIKPEHRESYIKTLESQVARWSQSK